MSANRGKKKSGLLLDEDMAELSSHLEKIGYRLRELSSTEKKALPPDWPGDNELVLAVARPEQEAAPGVDPTANRQTGDVDPAVRIISSKEWSARAAKTVFLEKAMPGLTHEMNNSISFITLNTPIITKIWQDLEPILERHNREHGRLQAGGYGFDELREEVVSLLDYMIAGANTVKRIVNSLNYFIEYGDPAEKQAVKINQALETALDLTQNIRKRAAVEISVDTGEGLPFFQGNRQQVVLALVNVIVALTRVGPNRKEPITIKTYYDQESESIKVEISPLDIEAGKMQPEDNKPGPWSRSLDRELGFDSEATGRIMLDHAGRTEFISSPDQGGGIRLVFPVKAENPSLSEDAP